MSRLGGYCYLPPRNHHRHQPLENQYRAPCKRLTESHQTFALHIGQFSSYVISGLSGQSLASLKPPGQLLANTPKWQGNFPCAYYDTVWCLCQVFMQAIVISSVIMVHSHRYLRAISSDERTVAWSSSSRRRCRPGFRLVGRPWRALRGQQSAWSGVGCLPANEWRKWRKFDKRTLSNRSSAKNIKCILGHSSVKVLRRQQSTWSSRLKEWKFWRKCSGWRHLPTLSTWLWWSSFSTSELSWWPAPPKLWVLWQQQWPVWDDGWEEVGK